MPRLFASFHLSRERVERALQRPLGGDASRGELALFYKLSADQLVEVRQALAKPNDSLKPDFVEFMRKHLEDADQPSDRPRQWTVRVPVDISRHYAERAAAARVPVATILEEAIYRDYQASQEARSLVEELANGVRTANTALATNTRELEGALKKIGNVNEITSRIGRIETILQDWARAASARR